MHNFCRCPEKEGKVRETTREAVQGYMSLSSMRKRTTPSIRAPMKGRTPHSGGRDYPTANGEQKPIVTPYCIYLLSFWLMDD